MVEEVGVETFVAAQGEVEDGFGGSHVFFLLGDLVQVVQEVYRVAQLVKQLLRIQGGRYLSPIYCD